jgi:signal transduction histidine kinase
MRLPIRPGLPISPEAEAGFGKSGNKPTALLGLQMPLSAFWAGVRQLLLDVVEWVAQQWRSWTLARQFATCASIILIPAMTVTGLWVGSRIEEGVTQRAGSSALLYMENFVEPLVQDLAVSSELSPSAVDRLGNLLRDTTLGQRVLSFKIWGSAGQVLAGSRADLIGQRFPMSPSLMGALRGIPKVEFDHLMEAENRFEKNLGVPILEIYVPLRARGSDQIIAVGEFYEKAIELKVELNRARIYSWLVVGGVTLSMLGALFAIVRRGSETIDRQRETLEQRVGELTDLLAENQQLRERARQASARAGESNEGYLRRLGADLHDGPAQLISAVLLRVDNSLAASAGEQTRAAQNNAYIHKVLTDALTDIRNLARGLAVPAIDALPLDAALRHAVDQHRGVTETRVAVDLGALPDVPAAVKLCAYRFVQEGLTNAFRHAGGIGQTVTAETDGDDVVLTVTDAGATGKPEPAEKSRGFGLTALADRIESIGGTLHIERCPTQGTRLTARLPIFGVDETGVYDA